MTIILTGANHGLGFEAVRALANETSRTIVLAGRNLPGLTRAAQRIQAETGNPNLFPMQLDLGSLDSVRAFSVDFRNRDLPPLNIIICNAGVAFSNAKRRSSDGYEETFAVNHLGHFLLVNLLADCLQPPARIIFVSSGAHDPAGKTRGPMEAPRFVHAEWLAYPERDPGRLDDDARAGDRAYASSKLCNVMCAYELARRLEASRLSTPDRLIAVNAFDPGLVAGTELGRHGKTMTRLTWYYILPGISRLFGFGRSPHQSGSDLAYLATAPELENVTSKYFSGREMVDSSVKSYDQDKAADLWQTSVELSRLQTDESLLMR